MSSIDTVAGAKKYKANIQHYINEQLSKIKEYCKKQEKALNKENWSDVKHYNCLIRMCFKHKETWENQLAECDYYITRAEWLESGYGNIVEFLETIFIKDMEWYNCLKEKVDAMSYDEVRQAIKDKTLLSGELSIAKMTEHEAKKEFRMDIVNRFKNLISRVEKKAGSIVGTQHLILNLKGELDGQVIGTKATVYVTTVGAGGHTIQRYHFRTLVRELNSNNKVV
jgi:hypothetical protein